jgi:hypothetical protein
VPGHRANNVAQTGLSQQFPEPKWLAVNCLFQYQNLFPTRFRGSQSSFQAWIGKVWAAGRSPAFRLTG